MKLDDTRRSVSPRWRYLAVAAGLVAVGAACGPTATARLVELGSGPSTIRTFDGMPALACGGIGPLSLLTATPGAENANTPEARGLRYLIAHDPTGGESPQSPHNWALMAEHGDQVTFGQRSGPLGIGAIVTLQRQAAGYRFAGSGGCGPVGYADGQQSVGMYAYAAHGRALTVDYTGDTCGSVSPTLKVVESRSEVDLLLVSAPPDHGSDGPQTACAGEGTSEQVHATLRSPVGTRTVRDIGYLPGRTVPRND